MEWRMNYDKLNGEVEKAWGKNLWNQGRGTEDIGYRYDI
jgi:hypothetical protein